MNIQKLFAVARWEFIEKVKTKAFIIGLLLTPLIMAMFAILPSFLASRDNGIKRFAVYDETTMLVASAQQRLNERGKSNLELVPVNPQSFTLASFLEQYSPRIIAGEFTGLVIIPADIESTHQMEYRSTNVGNFDETRSIETALQKSLSEHLAIKKGISAALYRDISKPLETKTIKISKSGEAKESSFLETFGLSYGAMLVYIILITTTSQILVRGLVEEKSNRIMEILISSCSPFELMMGKLIGLSALGIIQVFAWGAIAIGLTLYFGSAVAATLISLLPLVLVFTLLGYIFVAALMLGLGSLTNTDQEAQQINGYMMMIGIGLPAILFTVILRNPNSTLAKIGSYIPFAAPTVMNMRIAVQMPPVWEILTSIVVLLVSTVLIVYFAARLFRVGILSYGKMPTLPEIIGYLREK